MREQLGPVGLDELAERLAVTRLGAGEGRLGHGQGGPFTSSPGKRLLKVQHRRRREFIGELPGRPGLHQ